MMAPRRWIREPSRMRPIAPMTLLSLALLAAPAGAATVRVEVVDPIDGPKGVNPPYATVVYDGAPGEKNVVTVGEDAARAIVVTETGAPLTAGVGCNAQAPGTVVCPVVRTGIPTFHGIWVRLGDGDDRLTANAVLNAYGGAGNDVLMGSGSARRAPSLVHRPGPCARVRLARDVPASGMNRSSSAGDLH